MAMDKQQVSIPVTLDFSAAFDTVCYFRDFPTEAEFISTVEHRFPMVKNISGP